MANKQKNKGKAFERDICKIFSKVFDLNFERVPNSGSFIGGKNSKRIKDLTNEQILLAKGDIIPPSEMPNLIIECKSRKTFPFHQLLNQCKELEKWVDQTLIDYEKCGNQGIWLLLMKFNNKGMYICYSKCWKGLINNYNLNYVEYFYSNIKEKLIFEEFSEQWLTNNKRALLDICE